MRPEDPKSLARLHEELLFQRAYPRTAEDALCADRQLLDISHRVAALREAGHDLTELENYEYSGMAGTGITAVFCHGVARHLLQHHGKAVAIAWDAYDSDAPLRRLLPELIPLLAEEALVASGADHRRWIAAAARGKSDLAWLLDAIARRWPDETEQADRYDSLELPLRWNFGDSTATRTLMRLPSRAIFCHPGPLIRRSEVSLDTIPSLPPLPAKKLSRNGGALILTLARDTSAVRYRQLHGFTYGDPRYVYEIDAGRGVLLFLSGLPAAHRLPLRACHSMTIWKNGVPVGYFEGLSLFEHMDAGFNVYYTFRAGETAWIFAQVLRTCRQMLGTSCFSLDPYQIGDGNEEAIQSGAFWFYRKLGFRSVSPELRELTSREEARIAARPGYRTPPATLRRLVREPIIYSFPGTGTGEWDAFRLERLMLRLASGEATLALPPSIQKAKMAAEEWLFLSRMRKDAAFRKRVLKLGHP